MGGYNVVSRRKRQYKADRALAAELEYWGGCLRHGLPHTAATMMQAALRLRALIEPDA